MITSNRYYDMNGLPYPEPDAMQKWAFDFESYNNNIILQTHIGWFRKIHISTVWLGLNHQYGDGPPLIFETMISGGSLDQYQERYSTKNEALIGHKRAVKFARLGYFGKIFLKRAQSKII